MYAQHLQCRPAPVHESSSQSEFRLYPRRGCSLHWRLHSVCYWFPPRAAPLPLVHLPQQIAAAYECCTWRAERLFFFLVAVLQTGLAALFNTNINSVTKSNCLCAASPQRSKVAADMDVRELHASNLLHWPTSDMNSFAWWRKRTMSSSFPPTCSLGHGTPLAPPYWGLYQHLVIKQQVLLSWKPATKLSPTSGGVEAVPVSDL